MSPESDLARRSAEIRKFFRTTTSDKATVSQFLHDVELEIAEHQTEINKLKTTIYALEHKRNRLKRTAERYKALLAPIHAVPPEILATIFEFVCECNLVSRSKLPAAVRLSVVCGRWRDIVCSTPRLWSDVSIDFRSWTKDFHVLNELTERLVKKSGNCPLRLTLILPSDDFDGDQAERQGVHSALRCLVEHCERWESVALRLAPSHFPSSIFGSICGRLPLLTSLSLYRADGDPTNWSSTFNYFDNCPSLRSLRIHPQLFSDEQQASLPWSQLKSLRILAAFNDEAFSMLSLCPAVEHLELCRVGDLESNVEYSGHVASSDIKTLTITKACEQIEVDGVLQHTTLSGISSLVIMGDSACINKKDWPTWNGAHLQSFLHRSSCNITSLHFRNLPITDAQMLSVLSMIPSIKSLCIEEFTEERKNRIVSKTFLEGFTVKASLDPSFSVPLVPSLDTLKLVVHAQGLESDSFLEALSSRWLPDRAEAAEMGVHCLCSVTIVVLEPDGVKENGQLDGLFCFKDAGMRLSITYGTLYDLYPDVYEAGTDEEDGENVGEGTGD
ncbi:hypothetical protein V5O48_011877 [Marasmius crinis-equi]|uniref:F-box domain-containing protein n=1 Tax=Marasmius crinis-equi TaxID=585013 RepID=A0ABR3F4M5_9AGAR